MRRRGERRTAGRVSYGIVGGWWLVVEWWCLSSLDLRVSVIEPTTASNASAHLPTTTAGLSLVARCVVIP
jgi:hypothetical protein